MCWNPSRSWLGILMLYINNRRRCRHQGATGSGGGSWHKSMLSKGDERAISCCHAQLEKFPRSVFESLAQLTHLATPGPSRRRAV